MGRFISPLVFTLCFTLCFPKSLTFLDSTVADCSQEEEGDGHCSQHDACGEGVDVVMGTCWGQKVLGQRRHHGGRREQDLSGIPDAG